MPLTTIDWAVIIGYLLINLLIGIYYRQRASGNTAEFFISGRDVSWWLAGTSMVATTFAADTPLLVTGLVYAQGIAGNGYLSRPDKKLNPCVASSASFVVADASLPSCWNERPTRSPTVGQMIAGLWAEQVILDGHGICAERAVDGLERQPQRICQ